MKFSIIHIEILSGPKAKIYSLKYEGKMISELQGFMYKFQDDHSDLVKQITQRIFLIANRDGIQSSFFRRECAESHNVFRLLGTADLRIYCLVISNVILVFGSGGIKKSNKLSDSPALEREVNKLIKIENAINRSLKSGELILSPEGFEGNLNNIKL